VIRRTVAKVATLENAAKLGGISLQALIIKLRSAAGQSVEDRAVPNAIQAPDHASFTLSDHQIVEEIDADVMLERGVHPIGRIRGAVHALGRGEVVLLTSSFRPEPLIETMRRSGSTVHSSRQGARHFTYFAGPTAR
jgi:hypothetical protein